MGGDSDSVEPEVLPSLRNCGTNKLSRYCDPAEVKPCALHHPNGTLAGTIGLVHARRGLTAIGFGRSGLFQD